MANCQASHKQSTDRYRRIESQSEKQPSTKEITAVKPHTSKAQADTEMQNTNNMEWLPRNAQSYAATKEQEDEQIE